MKENPSSPTDMASISAVERDTGLAKDTLRIWERRYGFPQPLRDINGERIYPAEQVDRLRLLRRLLDNGHRPGKVVPLLPAELQPLLEQLGAVPAQADAAAARASSELHRFIDLLRSHQTDTLRQALLTRLTRLGLERFVVEVVAPMTTMVGEAWARGELAVFEEHLFTEQVSQLLRHSLNSLSGAESSLRHPRVLLTTFPQEAHGLGLLMAEAMLALSDCSCVSLGVQTPLAEIALAVQAQQADVVALSFSPCMNSKQLVEGLAELKQALPGNVEVWVGGSHPALSRRSFPGVGVVRDLSEVETMVERWRAGLAIDASTERR